MLEPVAIHHLVCERQSLVSTQWCAWNRDDPYRRSRGDHPAAAIRRFLEIHVDGGLVFDLTCDRDLVGNGELTCRMKWNPPELFLECSECRGSGSYTGLSATEQCRECEGQGSVKVLC